MAELYLIRHGQASFGSDNYDQLSELGVNQSERLGRYFAERDIDFDLVVTGAMKRHEQTADSILTNAKSNGSRLIDEGWNEFDFESVIMAYLTQYPEQTPDNDAPRSAYYKILKSAMNEWAEGSLDDRVSETWTRFLMRVDSARLQILNSSAKRVLVTTSGGAIAIKLLLLLGLTPKQAIDFNLQIKNASMTHFYFSSKGYQLSTFNSVTHLDVPNDKNLVTYS